MSFSFFVYYCFVVALDLCCLFGCLCLFVRSLNRSESDPKCFTIAMCKWLRETCLFLSPPRRLPTGGGSEMGVGRRGGDDGKRETRVC